MEYTIGSKIPIKVVSLILELKLKKQTNVIIKDMKEEDKKNVGWENFAGWANFATQWTRWMLYYVDG